MPDWKKIKRDYLRGGITNAALAKKYGVGESTIRHHAADEGWRQLRTEAGRRADEKTVDALSDQEAQVDTRIYNAAMLLMDCLETSVRQLTEGGSGLDPDSMRGYSTSLRSIQQVLRSRPTQRDIDEQQARIDKLRREAQKEEDTGGETLRVVFEGDMHGYSE